MFMDLFKMDTSLTCHLLTCRFAWARLQLSLRGYHDTLKYLPCSMYLLFSLCSDMCQSDSTEWVSTLQYSPLCSHVLQYLGCVWPRPLIWLSYGSCNIEWFRIKVSHCS